MQTIRRSLLMILLGVIASASIEPAFGQFRGRDDSDSDRDRSRDFGRGDRGDSDRSDRFRGFGSRGEDSSREGDRGSSRFGGGGFGPPSGGSFGPGGFGSRGGFGPPSGGFGPPSGGFGPPGGSFGPPGGFRSSGESGDRGDSGGRPSSDAFFDRLDRNGDGRLDGDEIPQGGYFGGMLERTGIREGASREDFTRGFERIRQERESGSNDDDRSRDRDDRGRSSQSAGFVPMKRDRITLELPAEFQDRDTNGDGQIAFHEWREWDRTQIDEFFFLDRNGDGFLTPKEIALALGGNDSSQDSRSQSDSSRSSDRSRERDSRPPTPSPPSVSNSAQPPLDENDPEVRKGRNYFAALDLNKDGQASVEELGALKRLRPQFDEAGVNLNVQMTEDEFVRNYLRTIKR